MAAWLAARLAVWVAGPVTAELAAWFAAWLAVAVGRCGGELGKEGVDDTAPFLDRVPPELWRPPGFPRLGTNCWWPGAPAPCADAGRHR